MKDAEIVRLILAGDEKGISEFLNHYEPLIRYIIAPFMESPEDTEECLSDVTMRVWEKIGLYDAGRGSFKGWLTAVSRNTAINFAAKSTQSRYSEEVDENASSDEDSPEEAFLRLEQRNHLRQVIKSLSPDDRILLYRRYYYMQPLSQIAAELGMSVRSVEGRLYRLKKKLEKRFKEVSSDD